MLQVLRSDIVTAAGKIAFHAKVRLTAGGPGTMSGMPDRVEPERTPRVHRAAIRARLISEGRDPGVAERWCLAWEAEAALRGLEPGGAAYWDVGERWINAQCAARKEPPN